MGRAVALFALAGQVASTLAQNITSAPDGTFSFDPILQFRPSFARSFPVQILMNGIILSLTVVLLVHLLFTAQYHWALGRVNYILQLSSVCALLVSLIATLALVLKRAYFDSSQWPYMIYYLSIDLPPPVNDSCPWSNAETVAWQAFDATTSGLVQVTHIQFLTFLYPSDLEVRLIFGLLGPLALTSSVMDLIYSQYPSELGAIAEVVRNICCAALSFLFTTALFIWGLVLHRPRSRSTAYPSVWRTDGGTAAFGISALALAATSTAINLVYIPSQDHYSWIRQLIWAVTLWQSFLGWWWWVGAGVGSESESVEEKIKKQEKRQVRKQIRQAKKEQRKMQAELFWRGVTGRTASSGSAQNAPSAPQSDVSSLINSTTARSSTASSLTQLRQPPHDGSFISRMWYWWGALRQAHQSAAQAQAMEQSERRQQIYGHEVTNATVAGVGVSRRGANVIGGLLVQGLTDRRGSVSGDEWEMSDVLDDGVAPTRIDDPELSARGRPMERPSEGRRGSSMSWWGPLRQWRLQDSTSYPAPRS